MNEGSVSWKMGISEEKLGQKFGINNCFLFLKIENRFQKFTTLFSCCSLKIVFKNKAKSKTIFRE